MDTTTVLLFIWVIGAVMILVPLADAIYKIPGVSNGVKVLFTVIGTVTWPLVLAFGLLVTTVKVLRAK